jgi:hypothetical protein
VRWSVLVRGRETDGAEYPLEQAEAPGAYARGDYYVIGFEV